MRADTLPPGPAKTRRASLGRLLALYPLLLVGLLWFAAAQFEWVRPVFLPAPDKVLLRLWEMLASGELIAMLETSMGRAFTGVALAAAIGIPIGFLAAEYRLLGWWLDPLVSIGFPLPKIALIPLITAWFGIDDFSKVFLVFLTCLFPFLIAARAASQLVPERLRWAALALGTGPRQMFRCLVLPATLPALFSGLRIALPIALITVFTAEMITSGGLGEAIIQAQRYFRSVDVYALILVTMLIGYLLDALLSYGQKRLFPWAGS